MGTHYLLDHEYLADEERLHGSFGHLLVFNPGGADAELKVTIFFEDQEPKNFDFLAPAGKSTETNYGSWPVEPGSRFAVVVASDQPVVCQSTIGWNNSKNSYSPNARTLSEHGVRECAKSYMAITELSKEWYLADGIVIDNLEKIYVRESEWAILLNPGDEPAEVTMALHYDDVSEHLLHVPARRLTYMYMDDVARRNVHYGARFVSSHPIAAQWLRTVKWSDESDLMTYWSVPLVAGPLEA